MSTPSISHPTGRPNYAEVCVGGIRYAFSYRTCIGAHRYGSGQFPITRKNIWGPTTGKHLNYWDGGRAEDKARRLDADDFQAALILLEDGVRA